MYCSSTVVVIYYSNIRRITLLGSLRPHRACSRSPSLSRSPGYSRSHYSRTPHTPAKSRHGDPVLEDMFSSPLVHHDSWDAYNGDGLKAFVTWCEGEYKTKGVEFAVAYQALKDQEISVDILKGKDPAWYTRMGVKVGTAERLVRSY